MNHDPKNPKMVDRDRFLLSKGHVAILQYSALAEAGYFPLDDLLHTKKIGSHLQGHPDVIKTPGIEAGTGSLGQGLSIGVGMAKGLKMDNIDSKVYVLCGDGSTHQAIEDMAIMRAIPNMTVICPADANETVEATKAIADYDGPVYMRLNRNDYDNVTEPGTPFKIGEPVVLKEGKDVVVFATGYMVGLALKAAETLKDKVSVKVVNVSTIKPLNNDKIIELAKDCKAVVTAEEHNVIGGLGGAIAEALRKSCKPIEFVGVEDVFGCSAINYQELLEHYDLTSMSIEKAINNII